jgi:DNA-directed RNA polymerases I, II, and III subunit RPABC3
MCGKTFKYDHDKSNRVSVIASYGGLLMQITGEQRHLARLRIDQKVYALMRKTVGGKS